MKFLIRSFAGICILLLLLGCAKFPTHGGGTRTKRLKFIVKLAGPVNPNYVYVVAINDANDLTGQNGGPIPVVAPPWGNGFVAGKATHFVRYDGFQGGGGYAIYRFTDLEFLLSWILTGIPVFFITPGQDSDELIFDLDLTQIRPNPEQALLIRALQINILTMDRVPIDPNDTRPKFWDALGDSRDPTSINDFITIDLSIDRFYRNSDTNLEPRGDVNDPSLDIVDWSIEIRTQ